MSQVIEKGMLFIRGKRDGRFQTLDLLDPKECSEEDFRKEVVNKIKDIYEAITGKSEGIRPWVYVKRETPLPLDQPLNLELENEKSGVEISY